MPVNRKEFPKQNNESVLRFMASDSLNRNCTNVQVVVTPDGHEYMGWRWEKPEKSDKQIRISMNSTACFTLDEFDEVVHQIRQAMLYEGPSRELDLR